MSRLYHSASSVELGRRCRRAWFYRYVQGIRAPEVEWSPELKGKARSLALGKAVHATIEKHFWFDGVPDWTSLPGEIAASGIHLLPGLTEAGEFYVEQPIGFTTGKDIGPGHDGKPRFTVEIAGVPWLGYRDLVHGPDGKLYDHKTTGSIADYAKSTAELLQDLQANLYAYDTRTERGTDTLACRWVYYETRKVRRAEPRDFVVHRAEALTVIECAAEIAKELDAITEIDHAPMNVNACADYGGCEFHAKAGGPCNATVPIGRLIQARVRKDQNIMPLDPSNFPKFNKPATTTAAEQPAPETTDEAPATPAQESAPAQTPAKPARGRPAKSAVGASGSLAAIAAELASAEAAHAETAAALEAAKDGMRKALA